MKWEWIVNISNYLVIQLGSYYLCSTAISKKLTDEIYFEGVPVSTSKTTDIHEKHPSYNN